VIDFQDGFHAIHSRTCYPTSAAAGPARALWSPRQPFHFHSARNHHLGGFDHRYCVIAASQVQGFHGVGCDHRSQALIANSETNLSEQAVNANFFNKTVKTVPGAQA
jgi:hypothetical protein